MPDENWREIKAQFTEQLGSAREAMAKAKGASESATDALLDLVTWVRSTGTVPVTDICKAIGRDQNYVYSAWSDSVASGLHEDVKPEWFGLTSASTRDEVLAKLAEVASVQATAAKAEKDARTARNRLVCTVYESKAMGPTAIGREAGMSCNHVLRVARRSGILPAHRTKIRNQYTADTTPVS